VLILRDSGLRSALIARLSLQGESVVTLDTSPDDPSLDRIARPPRILVIDTAMLGGHLAILIDSGRWRGIIILADSAEETDAPDRLCIIDQKRALVDVCDTLVRWRVNDG